MLKRGLAAFVLTAGMMGVAPVSADTLTLRQGGTYTETLDFYIDSANPTSGYSSFNDATQSAGRDVLEIWGDTVFTGEPDNEYDTTRNAYYQGLLKFDGILAALPAGAVVTSAELTLFVRNNSEQLSLYRMVTAWTDQNVSWNHFGSGAPADGGGITPGTDTAATPDYAAAIGSNSQTIDVTATVQAWVNGTANNYGWAILEMTKDRAQIVTSEDSVEVDRPTLTIEYTVSAIPEPAAVSLLGLGAVAMIRRKR